MSGKYLLKTSDAFDDMIDNSTVELWQSLRPIHQDPSSYETIEYLYQDYTYANASTGNPFPDKEKILQISFTRSDFIDQGITNTDGNFARFYIKSKIYAKMARTRSLSYFNKINFTS